MVFTLLPFLREYEAIGSARGTQSEANNTIRYEIIVVDIKQLNSNGSYLKIQML